MVFAPAARIRAGKSPLETAVTMPGRPKMDATSGVEKSIQRGFESGSPQGPAAAWPGRASAARRSRGASKSFFIPPPSCSRALGWSPMRIRPLGQSGLEVSVVGLGCNNFGGRIGEEDSRAVIDAALQAEITFFDTADVYGNRGGSEEIIGRALAGRRDRVVLATKFGHDMGDGEEARGSRAYTRKALEASLGRLQTDWVDLYQYHRPDGVTPLAETVAALDELVQEGRIRAYGTSNHSAEQVDEAHARARSRGWTPFVTEQSQYSWLRRDAERELLPICQRLGIGFVPYFPLASGLLTGKVGR